MSKSDSSVVKKKQSNDGDLVDADLRRHSVAGRLAIAVRRGDAKRVRDLAREAGAARWDEAVRPLCDFLVPPSARWRTPRGRKRSWSEARIAAIKALRDIENPSTYGVLVRTLACEPDPIVREVAADAVRGIGKDGVGHLVEVVRDPIDWNLHGMCVALTCIAEPELLSQSDRRSVGIVLTDVLFDNFPQAPRRWTRPARRGSKVLGFAVFLMIAYPALPLLQYRLPMFLMALFGSWTAGKFVEVITNVVASAYCTATRGRAERKALASVAASSLIRLNDRRAVPGMLQLAFGASLTSTSRQARRVLTTLLPRLTEQDRGLFSTLHIELMNGAVTRTLDSNLVLALLHGLEAVGDGTSVRRVERVIKRGRAAEIREKASKVLVVLRARDAHMQSAQSLLRGAAAPTGEPRELLRAAMPQSNDRPEQLLRATEKSCSDTYAETYGQTS